MRYAYPYEVRPEPEGGFFVRFPDVPEALTGADTEAEVAVMAEDVLVTALSFYTDTWRPLPTASAARGRPVATVPALAAAKLALHDALLAAGLSNLELGRRLGMDEKAVRRLRDPLHRSHIDAVEQALRVLGKRIEVTVRAA